LLGSVMHVRDSPDKMNESFSESICSLTEPNDSENYSFSE